ncbi:Fibrous sheath-interacting protein [Ooceraea biroi]|uniref:Fibrous sheath-interacting protein n=1 Tax=Ooceraea biroi TaxID=2015173 RepID=A0A026WST2_OOCBI|nr:Fibrous sheath-interacting protein [Ooceraea biroi]
MKGIPQFDSACDIAHVHIIYIYLFIDPFFDLFPLRDFDRFVETVPKPERALLNFGLPKWKMMPLERKIPMIPGPKDAYNLTRCKVGEKLWATDGPRMDFDPSDPCCRETRFSYEALHDQHLLRFFSKPTYRRCLLRASLITKDMDVKCSLREYNAYRKYLRKMYANRIGKELRKRDRLSVERRALRYAEEQARNKAERYNFPFFACYVELKTPKYLILH